MKTWIVEPHDSFIARDGRPFGLFPGVRATSLPFPFPSTTTGGVRTRDGLDSDGVFDTSPANITRVKDLEVHGALLVQIDNDARVVQWYVQAPADVLLLDASDKDPNKALVSRLIPGAPFPNAEANIPDDLLPLYLSTKSRSKPHGYAPRFWKWENLEKWLLDPRDFVVGDLYDFGLNNLAQDERSHVAIEGETQASEEHSLFQTRGLEFTRQKRGSNLASATRLALALSSDASNISQGVASLGGERRLVSWRGHQGAIDLFNSECPKAIVDRIVEDRACRVVLLTPAYFEAGWKPGWIMTNDRLTLKAAAVGRAQVISGWDFEFVGKRSDGTIIQGRPKPTRRLVPAGAVYFFKLNGDESALRNWIAATWMRCISDDDNTLPTEPRKDGFGLGVVGTWKEGKDVN